MSTSQVPKYLPGLLRTVQAKPGTIQLVTILHDDDCPKLRGGECTCQPEVELLNRHERRSSRAKGGAT